MMKKREIQHHTDALAALLLFGVFAACILAVLLTGAGAYRRLTGRDQAAYARRTALQYVATRVRQSDVLDQVEVEDFRGVTALVLREEGGYVTRVYCHDGFIKELYADEEEAFLVPGDGERILEARGLEFSLEDGLLTVTATDGSGVVSTLLLSLRSGEEGTA